jgi:DNA polymerase-3 subunit epsilon
MAYDGTMSAYARTMAVGRSDAELWFGICQRLVPVFAKLFQKRPGIGPLVFMDTETGGLEGGDIVELGAISVGTGPAGSSDVRMDYFWELIDPGGARVSPFAARIHGITPDMLKRHGRPPRDVLLEFAEWVGWASPKNLVAHNARFDKGMLEAAFSKHGVAYRLPEFLCTVRMAKGLPVENRQLGTLAKHFGYDNQQAHRSITDTEVCAYIFARMALDASQVDRHHGRRPGRPRRR